MDCEKWESNRKWYPYNVSSHCCDSSPKPEPRNTTTASPNHFQSHTRRFPDHPNQPTTGPPANLPVSNRLPSIIYFFYTTSDMHILSLPISMQSLISWKRVHILICFLSLPLKYLSQQPVSLYVQSHKATIAGISLLFPWNLEEDFVPLLSCQRHIGLLDMRNILSIA